jgi:DNA-binding transcriptional regulator YdaS (Cro superfamily)
MTTPLDHLTRAIEIAGGQSSLGRLTGRSQHAIWHAIKKGRCSVELAVLIERALHGQVTRQQLRPDVFAGDTASLAGVVRGASPSSSAPRTTGFA